MNHISNLPLTQLKSLLSKIFFPLAHTMQSILDYGELQDMDTVADNLVLTNQTNENTSSIANLFRTRSLLLATFPWSSLLPMTSSKLVESIGESPEEHYIFVGHSGYKSLTSAYRAMSFFFFLSFIFFWFGGGCFLFQFLVLFRFLSLFLSFVDEFST